MSYSENVQEADRQSQQDQAARVIHETLRKLLAGDHEKAARRWPWELLQNAHDVCDARRGVRVRITLDDGEHPTLAVSHDAGPFRSTDLVCLVKQFSHKQRGPEPGRPEPLGRFGTGFLTTHLLARIAHLEGVAADPDEAPRRFSIPLDRSGTTIDELRVGVEAAFTSLHTLDELPPLTDYRPGGFDTTYRYHLTRDGLAVAHQGLDDLDRLLPYVLAFIPRIRRVEITHMGTTFEAAAPHPLAPGLGCVDVTRTQDDGQHPPRSETLTLLLARNDGGGEGNAPLTLALPARLDDDTLTLLDLPDRAPRLFCGFPLVGTEGVGLPCIVNAPAFYPAETRDGITLSRASDPLIKRESEANKRLLIHVPPLYRRLLDAAAAHRWQRSYVLADIGPVPETPWLQEHSWFKAHLTNPLRKAALAAELVETAAAERRAVHDPDGAPPARFPAGPDPQARRTLWELAEPLYRGALPRKDHLEAWRQRIWTDRYDLAPAHLVITAAQGNLEGLAGALNASPDDALDWLSRLVAFLRQQGLAHYLNAFKETFWAKGAEDDTRKRKRWHVQVPVLPNQHGRFHYAEDLLLEPDPLLDEALKDVAERLGDNVRARLLHRDIELGAPKHPTLTADDLARSITERAYDRIKNRDPATREAFAALLQWFDHNPDDAAHRFGRLYHDQHLLQTPEEIRQVRQTAARAEELTRERDRLADEIARLRAELEKAQQTQNEQTDTGTDEAADRRRIDEDEAVQLAHHCAEVWEAVRNALQQSGTARAALTARELDALRHKHPEYFRHVHEASYHKYLAWLQMLARAQERVRAHLDATDAYCTERWHTTAAFPTIVEGVTRRAVRSDSIYPPHEVTLVIRPADGGYIVFYDEQEVAILQTPDTELWIEGDGVGPERFTLGTLADRLGINRFPVRKPLPAAHLLTS